MTQTYLIGAYERENFGDLLFLLLTEKYLSNVETVATAPYSAPASSYLPKRIESYDKSTERNSPSAVWSVGGEVGGTSAAGAFRMSATDAQYAAFMQIGTWGQRAFLANECATSPDSSPYLPRMSARTSTLTSKFIVNSAGLSGMARLLGNRRVETWGAIREAGFVSVRDHDSHVMLERTGVPHFLAPDLVQTLPRHYDLLSSGSSDGDVALIQIKGATLKRLTVAKVASILVSSRSLASFRLRLFVAGSARGHDDSVLYSQLVNAIKELQPNRDVSLSQSESPLEKAAEIANCGIWIGTSLHGLIISSAYDLPRVGLELEKLQRYASTWQETMPVGVKLEDLDVAVAAALRADKNPLRASSLDDLAHENMGRAIKFLHEPRSTNLSSRNKNKKRIDIMLKNPIGQLLSTIRN